jgi:hypothetical protein
MSTLNGTSDNVEYLRIILPLQLLAEAELDNGDSDDEACFTDHIQLPLFVVHRELLRSLFDFTAVPVTFNLFEDCISCHTVAFADVAPYFCCRNSLPEGMRILYDAVVYQVSGGSLGVPFELNGQDPEDALTAATGVVLPNISSQYWGEITGVPGLMYPRYWHNVLLSAIVLNTTMTNIDFSEEYELDSE